MRHHGAEFGNNAGNVGQIPTTFWKKYGMKYKGLMSFIWYVHNTY